MNSIKSININSFKDIDNVLEDKTFAFGLLQINEGSFIGYNIKPLNTIEDINNILPIKMYYDNNIKEMNLLNTEKFYKLSEGIDILIAQAIEDE